MKGLESMKTLAGRGVIIEWDDTPPRTPRKQRQARIMEFPIQNFLVRKGEAKFI